MSVEVREVESEFFRCPLRVRVNRFRVVLDRGFVWKLLTSTAGGWSRRRSSWHVGKSEEVGKFECFFCFFCFFWVVLSGFEWFWVVWLVLNNEVVDERFGKCWVSFSMYPKCISIYYTLTHNNPYFGDFFFWLEKDLFICCTENSDQNEQKNNSYLPHDLANVIGN